MSWGNPWAWLGLVGLTVPLLIHLLGRRQAKTLPYPTLRFLEASRLQPVRRTRIHDIALLATRLAVLLFAVAALAQPLFRTGAREAAAVGTLARVVIVDTSASMRRPAADTVPSASETAADAARREGRRLADDAAVSVIVETASPAAELAGADAWLALQPGPGEIVVLSDFQSGTLDSAALEAIRPAAGIDLRRVAVREAAQTVESVWRSADLETVSRAVPTVDGVDATWSFRPASVDAREGLSLLTGAADSVAAEDAASAAWQTIPGVRFNPGRPVAVVYDGYEGRTALLDAARPVAARWIAEAIRRVRDDEVFAAAEPAESNAETEAALSPDGAYVRFGAPAAGTVAASADVDGREHLVLFTSAAPGSLASAALIGAIGRAFNDDPPVAELDPFVADDPTLMSWQRAPAARSDEVRDDSASDGRWLWLIVLALLTMETLYRRRADAARRGASAQPEGGP
jgi:hypothetical protein